MPFSQNKKDNRATVFVTLAIMRRRSRDLFSNFKMEQKTGLCQIEELLSNRNRKRDEISQNVKNQ